MSDPAAVPATYARLSTLADGTVRVVIDVEPRHRAKAFAIFTEPGVPLAVARLSNEAARAADQTDARQSAPAASQEAAGAGVASSPAASDPLVAQIKEVIARGDEPRRKRCLSEHVAMTCEEQSFRDYLRALGYSVGPGQTVADIVRRFCRVASRAEIVTGSEAAQRWGCLTAGYEQFQRSRNVRTLAYA